MRHGMSRHWNPDEDLARIHDALAKERATARAVRVARAKPRWPEGATAGLILVATACIGLSILLYRIGGPRDVFAP
jgi:hypothetical protein